MSSSLPHERKRVKVYELKSNDWFDRGTGFCTGQLVNVCISTWTTLSSSYSINRVGITRQAHVHFSAIAEHFITATDFFRCYRMKLEYTYSPKMNLTAPYSRPRYPKMMATRNNKVRQLQRVIVMENAEIRLQIPSLCGQKPMSRTWPLVSRNRKVAPQFG
jgi:hypothetical protein